MSMSSRRMSLVAGLVVLSLVWPAGQVAIASPVSPPDGGSPITHARRTPSWAATIEAGRAAMEAAMAATGASSASVAFLAGGAPVWVETFGAVDADGTRPDPAATRYGIGSISKTLAAAAVLRLVDAGLVDLDAPAQRYVPELTMADPAVSRLTVRMLLDHTAGLPGSDYANAATTVPYPGYLSQLLAGLATERLKTPPGAMAVYCNDCYSLTELIVQHVTQRSYADYVTEEILRPLGMEASMFAVEPPPAGSVAPVLGPDGHAGPLELLNLYASGGLYSTPTDMGRFAAMLLGGGTLDGTRILSEAAVREMTRDQTVGTFDPLPSDDWRYGLGFDSVRQPGLSAVDVEAWVKGGDTADYHASMILVPGADLVAVVQLAGSGASSSVAEGVAERVLLQALVERGDLRRLPKPVAAPGPARKAPSEARLAAIAGTWVGSGVVQRLTPDADGRVRVAQYASGTWTEGPDTFSLRKDGWFWADSGLPRGFGVVEGWGRRYLGVRYPGGAGHWFASLLLGERVGPGLPLPAAWAARVGRTWLPVTEVAASTAWAVPALTLGELPELPGYLVVPAAGNLQVLDPAGSETRAFGFQVIPKLMGRDLFDLLVEKRGAQEWLRTGSSLLRPADGVPHLRASGLELRVDPDAVAAWAAAREALRVATTGADAWKLFDASFAPLAAGDGEAVGLDVPAGAYLVVFAAPGASVTIDPA